MPDSGTGTAEDENGGAQLPVDAQEQRLSTPTRRNEPGAQEGTSSRGVGATSLQKYLSSVGDNLTPDEDEVVEAAGLQTKPYLQRIGIDELRREAQSARDILALVLDDVQTRDKRGTARHADISRMATSILASVRELGAARGPPVERKDATTQTDSCDGLAPLAQLRIEDDVDMVQLMLLTTRVAAQAAQESSGTSTSGNGAQSPCQLHAEQ